MGSCKRLYTLLFNHITDALEQLDCGRFQLAKDILAAAQQESEEMFIDQAYDGKEAQ